LNCINVLEKFRVDEKEEFSNESDNLNNARNVNEKEKNLAAKNRE